MRKEKLGVVFGGMSTEHDVSIVSGLSVLKNIKQEKYEIFPIYIGKNGRWYLYQGNYQEIQIEVGDPIRELQEIEDVFRFLRKMDIVFPVLHGLYGEDGTIQGFFELLKIPYVGCGVLSSSIAMDKVYTKILFEKADLKQAQYVYVRKRKDEYYFVDKEFKEEKNHLKEIAKRITQNIQYPMFVKPSNSGSSVGIQKVKKEEELINAINNASDFDNKILIEEAIVGKELECAVLGNDEVRASTVGEITPAEEFYSFGAKYKNVDSKITIPANIPKEKIIEIQEKAIRAFQAIDGKGLARVDFFMENQTGEIYINEINTLPGFTNISMYSKLWEETGKSYTELLEELIQLAKEKSK